MIILILPPENPQQYASKVNRKDQKDPQMEQIKQGLKKIHTLQHEDCEKNNEENIEEEKERYTNKEVSRKGPGRSKIIRTG